CDLCLTATLTSTWAERSPLPWTARQEKLADFISLWTVIDCYGRNTPNVVFVIPLCRGLSTEVQVTRALVIYKKSYYELYGYTEREGRFAVLQAHRQTIIEAMWCSHEESKRTLEAVQMALEAVGTPYDCGYRRGLGSAAGDD